MNDPMQEEDIDVIRRPGESREQAWRRITYQHPIDTSPTKYADDKNPALSDAEYEAYQARVRLRSHLWLLEHDGTNPGDFLGYHACTGNQRIDIIRPESGDWRCEACGFVMPLVQGPAQVVAEGSELMSDSLT